MRKKSVIAAIMLIIGLTCGAVTSSLSAKDLSLVFKDVGEAVVVVRTTERAESLGSNGRQVSMQGLGSGVLVSADGKIVTAAHIVQTADTVIVEFSDQAAIAAKVIASEPAADVALLQLERVPDDVKPVKLGDSDKVQIGEQVLVVGAPLGSRTRLRLACYPTIQTTDTYSSVTQLRGSRS